MSLFGVTFKDQPVSAYDHAALTALILRDGYLRGCDMSCSGSMFTLGAGHLLAAGRIVGNDASLAIPISASSGVARVTLVIDMSATSTDEDFQQVSIRVDYATSLSALPALVQEDINDGVHTDYEVALAVLSISGGAATISSRLGRAALRIRFGYDAPTTADLDPYEIYLQLSN